MNDEDLLHALREVRVDGAPATSANIRGAAALGTRFRRRRRATTALGSGLTVAGFTALLFLASPNGQTVVQGATPAQTSVPNADDPRPSAHDTDVNLLRQALGTAAWDLAFNRSADGTVSSGPLDLGTTATAGRGLPSGFVATSFVTVQPARAGMACATLSPGPRTVSCRDEKPAGGGTLQLSRTVEASGEANNGTLSAVTHVAYQRPSDSLVSIWLAVTGWSQKSKSDQKAALTWLAGFDDRLRAVATDPRMRTETPGSTPVPLPAIDPFVNMAAARSNNERMLAHLGVPAGWAMVYDNDSAGHQSEGLAPLPGSPAATGLPAGWTAGGGAGLDAGSSCSDSKPIMHCSIQQTPDGQQVDVWHTDFPPTQSNGGDRLQVLFIQQMDDRALVSLGASWPVGAGNAADQKQAIAWLNSWLDKLIATAQDPALRAARYPTPATTCCGG